MRSTLAVAAACAALLVGSLGTRLSGSTGPISLNCDRACLEGVIDQYLAAVVAHDPKRVPLSADVKYTENNQVIDVGATLLTGAPPFTHERRARNDVGGLLGLCPYAAGIQGGDGHLTLRITRVEQRNAIADNQLCDP